MALRESEAIILRSYSLGEADRLVSFFSRKLGRMRGVAPGARRTKTTFGSALEPLTYVRIAFAEKETRDLVRIRQCEVIESAMVIQADYDCSLALGLVAEVCDLILPEREASDPAFRLLLLVTRETRRLRKPWLPVVYFLLWMVRLAGWLPSLAGCGRCRRALRDDEAVYVSPVHTLPLCTACRLPGMRVLSAESAAAARRMLQCKLEELDAAAWPPQKCRDTVNYLLDVIEHQAERKLKTRGLLEHYR